MTIETGETLTFTEAERVLREWHGERVSVEFSHRSLLLNDVQRTEAILDQVTPIPDEFKMVGGRGIWVECADDSGAVFLSLLIHAACACCASRESSAWRRRCHLRL